jgi:putative endonuclease
MSYSVYILYSAHTGKFYVGYTADVEKRLKEHLNPIQPKYTSRVDDWEIYLVIKCNSKTHAIKLERYIKKMKSSVFIQSLKSDEIKRQDIVIKLASDG